DYGVEEYYIYDPDRRELSGWLRRRDRLREIPRMDDWISPRLDVRFDMSDGELTLFAPNQRPFASYLDLAAQRDAATAQRDAATAQRDRLAQSLAAEQ